MQDKLDDSKTYTLRDGRWIYWSDVQGCWVIGNNLARPSTMPESPSWRADGS